MSFKLRSFVQEVVKHLPEWKQRTPHDSQTDVWEHIEGKDGAVVTFHLAGKQDAPKIEVWGKFIQECGRVFPHDANKRVETIRVSPSRSAEAIAKDVQRRLLSAYVPVYLEGKKIFEQETAHYDRLHKLTQEFADILGDWRHSKDSQTASYYMGLPVPHDTTKQVHVEVKVNSEDSVELTINSLPADLAKQILGLFNQTPRPRPKEGDDEV